MNRQEASKVLAKQVKEFLDNGGTVTKVASVPAPKQVANRVYNSSENVIATLLESRRY